MNILICNQEDAATYVKKDQDLWHVLSLRDVESGEVPVDEYRDCCLDMCVMHFNDHADPRNNTSPNAEHVKRIVEWGTGRDDVLCHCRFGRSRSSAAAYLIACANDGVEQAIRVVSTRKHRPNSLMVKLGAELLNCDVWDAFDAKYDGFPWLARHKELLGVTNAIR